MHKGNKREFTFPRFFHWEDKGNGKARNTPPRFFDMLKAEVVTMLEAVEGGREYLRA